MSTTDNIIYPYEKDLEYVKKYKNYKPYSKLTTEKNRMMKQKMAVLQPANHLPKSALPFVVVVVVPPPKSAPPPAVAERINPNSL